MGEFSLSHMIIIAVVFLVFFGPSRLPGLGKSIGESIKGFKKAMSDETPSSTTNTTSSQVTHTETQAQAQAEKAKETKS
jgi:TatA/E family protein of Tat protein translocase